jgi:hypothetical protein
MTARASSRSSRLFDMSPAHHEIARTRTQRLAALDEFHVPLHLLELPSERVRDERELRQ